MPELSRDLFRRDATAILLVGLAFATRLAFVSGPWASLPLRSCFSSLLLSLSVLAAMDQACWHWSSLGCR